MSAAEILTADDKRLAAVKYLATTLHYDQLQASPLNPRKHARDAETIAELAASIAVRGILQNLVVRPHKTLKGKYEIAAGEGRWRAVGHLIDTKRATAAYELPVSIRDLSDDDMIEIGLIENGQRNDLHPLDEAKAFLKLHDSRVAAAGGKAKVAGIAAGADVIKTLADKMGKTPRYVQKRIQLARNLAPKAVELLEKGTISLVVAQELSKRTAEEQRGFLSSRRHGGLEAMTADYVAEQFKSQWRPMADAIFPPADYKGGTADVDGAIYATDRKAFDRLQMAAADGVRRECQKAAKDGKIKFFEEGSYFNEHDYRRETGPSGGVFLELKRFENTVRVHRGLVKTAARLAHDKRMTSFDRAARAPSGPKRHSDKRVPALAAFCAASSATMMAVQVYEAFSDYQTQLQFFRPHQWHRTGDDRAKERLTKLHKGPLPKGAALLGWLLKRKPDEIASIWTALASGDVRNIPVLKASKVDEVLFDHCRAKKAKTS